MHSCKAAIAFIGMLVSIASFQNSYISKCCARNSHELISNCQLPKTASTNEIEKLRNIGKIVLAVSSVFGANAIKTSADDYSSAQMTSSSSNIQEKIETQSSSSDVDFGSFKIPYFHENLPFKQFIGPHATIVFNMKIDDPQTVLQFPDLAEIFRKYSSEGLHVHAFPTEQGWFEPDDDEACRLKAKEYYGFGDDFPKSVVFDKIDLLGPSAHPFYQAITKALPTPNGYNRITLNYEKFLLDSSGKPLRRYPRKWTAYEMEPDILALLKGEPLPAETPAFAKAWREARREVEKGEYSFRYNYNYYTAPNSMYKYDPKKDQL